MGRLLRRLAAALCAALLPPALAVAAEPTPHGEFRGAMATDYPTWFRESFLELAEDVAEAKAAGKRVVLIFYQDGCPYCHALVNRNLAQKDIETLLRARFEVIALNLWGDRPLTTPDGARMSEKQYGARLGVQFTPTVVFLDESGKTVLRLNGYIPPAKFKVALDFVAGRHDARTSYRDYAAAHEPPAAPGAAAGKAKGALGAASFFAPGPHDLKKLRRPLAVFFEQKDCPDCETLHRGALADAEVRAALAGAHVVQLDMWGSEALVTPQGARTTAKDWARALDIRYAPSVVVFDADGREAIRAESEFKSFHLRGIVEYVTSGAHRREPSFQRYLAAKAEALREAGQTVDIWR